MRLFILALALLCSAVTVTAQSVQSQFKVITPGTPIFAVNSDYYQITVPTGKVTAYTTGSSDTIIYIYDSSARLITEDDDSGEDYNAMLSFHAVAGTYFIRIEYAGDSGPYVLHIE